MQGPVWLRLHQATTACRGKLCPQQGGCGAVLCTGSAYHYMSSPPLSSHSLSLPSLSSPPGRLRDSQPVRPGPWCALWGRPPIYSPGEGVVASFLHVVNTTFAFLELRMGKASWPLTRRGSGNSGQRTPARDSSSLVCSLSEWGLLQQQNTVESSSRPSTPPSAQCEHTPNQTTGYCALVHIAPLPLTCVSAHCYCCT